MKKRIPILQCQLYQVKNRRRLLQDHHLPLRYHHLLHCPLCLKIVIVTNEPVISEATIYFNSINVVTEWKFTPEIFASSY